MPVTLITGPHQSGKSRALWRRLRAEPMGAAVLVVPAQGLTHELVRAAHAWGGDGLMPPVVTLAELVERCAAGVGDTSATLSAGAATHVMRGFCRDGLTGTRWERLAHFRA
ncbi:MAG: hypothetical protein H0X45_10710, partial [Planctomycetes bacterium]|nr:hypothetical protein [Planctomycetota bacterium]